MTTALQTLTNKLAERFEMGNGVGLTETLKASAFAGSNVNDAQMVALLVIANQYQLNPWAKEIYAFSANGGITPIVGVDGWICIINREPQYDGIEFSFTDDYSACTCTIYRKDRSKPIVVTEFMDECKKNSIPWNSHPRRMLRHKAMIQCARLAFGFSGIYDQDEAENIKENERKDVTQEPNVIDVQAIELITPEQRQQIDKLIELTQPDTTKALAYYGAESLDKLSKVAAENFIKKLNTKLDKANQQVGEEIQL